jgi:hypothetical protein
MAGVSDPSVVRSTARIVTDRPERYVKQLVSHLGHKLTTELAEDGRGTIRFAQGECALAPRAGYIDADASAVDAAALATVEDVVARHLIRFAPADELTVTWIPAVGD